MKSGLCPFNGHNSVSLFAMSVNFFISFIVASMRQSLVSGFLSDFSFAHRSPLRNVKKSTIDVSSSWKLHMSASSSSTHKELGFVPTDKSDKILQLPQVMASGYSQAIDMVEAINEAVAMALKALPPYDRTNRNDHNAQIDLAFISVSSLYDGNTSPSTVVPSVLQAAACYGKGIQHLIGSTCGGFISSQATFQRASMSNLDDDERQQSARMCTPVEQEGVPGISVVFCILPDVNLQTFHVIGEDVPDDYKRLSSKDWLAAIGLATAETATIASKSALDGMEDDSQAIFLIPSPAFSSYIDELLKGFGTHLPESNVFGAIASTVSSLSRARLFRHDASANTIHTLADGCVGVVMSGDIRVETMIAQGAKPVGGIYQVVKGQDTTISAIALDETATEMVQQAEMLVTGSQDDGDNIEEEFDRVSPLASAYAKARIPKPALAEANFLMKTLSDDDQAFMRKALLVGLACRGSLGRTPSELARLAEGKSHNFAVHPVASAAMKDGSVTLSLGSVSIVQGTRMRFFVREPRYSKREVEAIWTGYKKRTIFATNDGKKKYFVPTGCFLFPTLDRGNRFFQGKAGFESTTASRYLPSTPCISGFFSNGVIGAFSSNKELNMLQSEICLHGSASAYILIGSKSNRPLYYPEKGSMDLESQGLSLENQDFKIGGTDRDATDIEKKAPRDSKGELILKRREVHAGRALTVSAVEWSVAEKSAYPTSALEGYMWDKETEVDRFRERVPLANLLSQCKLSAMDPLKPKPRDWKGPVKEVAAGGSFVIVPECKRTDPFSGSLRKRYDLSKLVKELVAKGAPALSINCDGVLFGGSLEDVTKAREASTNTEASCSENGTMPPPILASDLILYPYQLYKLRLAGADAVNLLVGALATKDLVYLIKIAKSVQMQSLLTVTSTAQVENLNNCVDSGSVDGIIVSNRELEDYSFDMSGGQALAILRSNEMKLFREKHTDALVLVEGRVGIIQWQENDDSKSPLAYIQHLKEAGADGAIVGGGLVPDPCIGRSNYLQSFRLNV
jgi:indole-3-glycerol phosphate synthase